MRQGPIAALVLLIAVSPLSALAQGVPVTCVAAMDPAAYLACLSQKLSELRARLPSRATERSAPLTELGTLIPRSFKEP